MRSMRRSGDSTYFSSRDVAIGAALKSAKRFVTP